MTRTVSLSQQKTTLVSPHFDTAIKYVRIFPHPLVTAGAECARAAVSISTRRFCLLRTSAYHSALVVCITSGQHEHRMHSSAHTDYVYTLRSNVSSLGPTVSKHGLCFDVSECRHSQGPHLLELVADHNPPDPTSPARSLIAERHPAGAVQSFHGEVDLQLLGGG